jgi:hypothetical protein
VGGLVSGTDEGHHPLAVRLRAAAAAIPAVRNVETEAATHTCGRGEILGHLPNADRVLVRRMSQEKPPSVYTGRSERSLSRLPPWARTWSDTRYDAQVVARAKERSPCWLIRLKVSSLS